MLLLLLLLSSSDISYGTSPIHSFSHIVVVVVVVLNKAYYVPKK